VADHVERLSDATVELESAAPTGTNDVGQARGAREHGLRIAGQAILDLLAAQRDLAPAPTTEIQSCATLLTTSAALTFGMDATPAI